MHVEALLQATVSSTRYTTVGSKEKLLEVGQPLANLVPEDAAAGLEAQCLAVEVPATDQAVERAAAGPLMAKLPAAPQSRLPL